MGHLVPKDLYQNLAQKIDSLWLRAPQTDAFFAALKELYSEEEALLVIKMPYSFSTTSRIAKVTGIDESKVKSLVTNMAEKGLVIDIVTNGEFVYMPSPIVIGVFEFTMMRTDGDIDFKKISGLFHEAMLADDEFFSRNCSQGTQMSVMRTLPHEHGIPQEDYVEILDYEKATHLVNEADRFAIGTCSCRHKKLHMGEKHCDTPLDTCTSFGMAADYVIRHKMAKEISKEEMLDKLTISQEWGLVLNADNTRRGIRFICQCCGCCCTMLQGINTHGYANALMTSSYIAAIEDDDCTGCGKCAKACPINAISMVDAEPSPKNPKRKKKPVIDEDFCLGCGVCTFDCKTNALTLMKRKQKIIHPSTTFERVILQTLDVGTLQNTLFDNPSSLTQKAMRGFLGGFFRLSPVKKALLSDTLQSTFLAAMKAGAKIQGRGWLIDV